MNIGKQLLNSQVANLEREFTRLQSEVILRGAPESQPIRNNIAHQLSRIERIQEKMNSVEGDLGALDLNVMVEVCKEVKTELRTVSRLWTRQILTATKVMKKIKVKKEEDIATVAA